MSSVVVPLFATHLSMDSLLTVEEPGKAKPGAPVSVYDCAKEAGLSEVVILDSRIDSFIDAYKSAAKAGVKLCFGVKLAVCADHRDKTDVSRRTESKVAVFVRNTQGYYDLIKLYNRGWTDGHFTFRSSSYGRIDWTLLSEFWTENLLLGLPYFSSFLARNTLTFNHIVPQLPVAPWVFKEVGHKLPFGMLIDDVVDRYMVANPEAKLVPCKSVYYRNRSDFKAYQVYRAIHSKGTYDAPEIDQFASDEFCLESWREQVALTPLSQSS